MNIERLDGGIVFLPEGNYLIKGHLIIGKSVVLKGVASHVQKQWGDPANGIIVETTLLTVADQGDEKMVFHWFHWSIIEVELKVYKSFILNKSLDKWSIYSTCYD